MRHTLYSAPQFQHGFRARHSTETALIQLIDIVATAVDNGEVAVVASLDLAGAFDTIDLEVMISKFEKTCGITDTCDTFAFNKKWGKVRRVKMAKGNRGNGCKNCQLHCRHYTITYP